MLQPEVRFGDLCKFLGGGGVLVNDAKTGIVDRIRETLEFGGRWRVQRRVKSTREGIGASLGQFDDETWHCESEVGERR